MMLVGEGGSVEFPFGISGYGSVGISGKFSRMCFKFLRLIFSDVLLKSILRVLHALSL